MGPWRFAHLRQHRSRPKDRFALKEPMGGLSAQFLSMYPSVRLDGTISTIFFQPFAFPRLYQSVRLHGLYPIIFFRTGTRAEADHLDRFPVRVIAHGRHISLSFYLPPSVGLLLTIWTDFCTRDRAWEVYFALFLSTAERRLTADHLDRFSVRVTAHERYLSLSFYLPPSVGLLLTIWTDFLYA